MLGALVYYAYQCCVPVDMRVKHATVECQVRLRAILVKAKSWMRQCRRLEFETWLLCGQVLTAEMCICILCDSVEYWVTHAHACRHVDFCNLCISYISFFVLCRFTL